MVDFTDPVKRSNKNAQLLLMTLSVLGLLVVSWPHGFKLMQCNPSEVRWGSISCPHRKKKHKLTVRPNYVCREGKDGRDRKHILSASTPK